MQHTQKIYVEIFLFYKCLFYSSKEMLLRQFFTHDYVQYKNALFLSLSFSPFHTML